MFDLRRVRSQRGTGTSSKAVHIVDEIDRGAGQEEFIRRDSSVIDTFRPQAVSRGGMSTLSFESIRSLLFRYSDNDQKRPIMKIWYRRPLT